MCRKLSKKRSVFFLVINRVRCLTAIIALQTVFIDVSSGEKYLGCYFDQPQHRLLDDVSTKLATLTPSSCIDLCLKQQYWYAGLENGDTCYCGNQFPSMDVAVPDKKCDAKCPADLKSTCGGNLTVSIYETGAPKTNARPRSTYLGCYKDTKIEQNQRNFSLLNGFWENYKNSLRPKVCDEVCYKKGFRFFGITMGTICYCGDQRPPVSHLVSEKSCYQSCPGDSSKKCGGKWEFNMYSTGISDVPMESNYLGCAADPIINKLNAEYKKTFEDTNSPRRCVNICGQLGYEFGGVENGEECLCSNGHPSESSKVPDESCDMSSCPGDPTRACGAKERLKLYRTFANGVTTKTETQKYLGCFIDQKEHRIFEENRLLMDGTLSVESCIELCTSRGYPFAGLENGVMCYCDYQFPSKNVQTNEEECNATCSGNQQQMCGGSLRIAVYQTGNSKINSRPRSTYLGCYHDSKSFFEQRNGSLLKGEVEDFGDITTIDFCDTLCYKEGFLYFGLTVRNLCYCGDQKPPQMASLPNEKCYKRCEGQPYRMCGGNWEFSMYSTGITDFPINGKYLGCTKNPSGNKLQPEKLKMYVSTNSQRRCVNICGQLGYNFSGVENGEYCYCSNKHPESSSQDVDSACNIVPCPGDPNHNCGDKDRLMVFRTHAEGMKGKKNEEYLGCYIDQEYHRLLDGSLSILNVSLTPAVCIGLCFTRGYPIAGVEYGNSCYCGQHFPSINVRTVESECNLPCTGDSSKICGGNLTLSAYRTGLSEIDSRPRSIYLGCYHDQKVLFEQKNNSILKGYWEDFGETLTPKLCDELCYKNGFLYFGMTVGKYCYCGDQQPPETYIASDTECHSECLGESFYKCGGTWRFSIYATGITDFPIDNNYLACINDDNNKYSSVAEFRKTYDATNAPRRCVNICGQLGYQYSGIENENECLCSNGRPDDDNDTDTDSACNVLLCPGSPTDTCGNKKRIKLLKTHSNEFKAKKESMKYLGCHMDRVDHRVLDGAYLIRNTSLTPKLCVGICFQRGYPFAGTEEGKFCYCGQHFPSINIIRSENECKDTCTGDRTQYCGGSLRISVYETGITKINSRPRSSYLGCYHDHKPTFEEKEKSILKGYWEDFDVTLTPQVCDTACHKRGYLYFGMTIGNYCYCGDQKPSETDLLPDEKCYKYCSGENQKRCGGNWEFSVYSTGITDASFNGNYVGCIKNPTSLPLPIEIKRKYKDTNSPRRCANVCQQLDYKYAGLENGEICYCSNGTPQSDLFVDDLSCNIAPCPGDENESCGGKERIKLFRTLKEDAGIQPTTDQTTEKISNSTARCEQKSVTMVNGQYACSGEVLFSSDFTEINTNIWKYTSKIPFQPDYEFVRYEPPLPASNGKHIYTKEGKLFIQPMLLKENEVTEGDLTMTNCTGIRSLGECSQTAFSYKILPPIRSAEITTENSLNFRYGTINMKVKFPTGDWIIPQLWLKKKNDPSVVIKIGAVRGNKHYQCNQQEFGSTMLEGGIYVSHRMNTSMRTYTAEQTSGWSDESHVLTVIWSPDNLSILADGTIVFSALDDDKINIREALGLQNASTDIFSGPRDETESKLYPFDDEFYLVIGVAVGGVTDFRDNCNNNGKNKPWSNTAPKALLRFWEDRENWHKTWIGENSALCVEKIDVEAL